MQFTWRNSKACKVHEYLTITSKHIHAYPDFFLAGRVVSSIVQRLASDDRAAILNGCASQDNDAQSHLYKYVFNVCEKCVQPRVWKYTLRMLVVSST